MESISSGFKVLSVIFLCLMTGLIDASALEISDQYASDSGKLLATKHFERKSTCQICHPNLEVIDNVTTQNINVEREERPSQVDIGLPKKQVRQNTLEVKGKILAEDIVVETKAPDFVFAPSHRLQSFKFIEDFIAENQHRPRIPSRASVETM